MPLDTPCGREVSEGSKGSKGSEGGGIALAGDKLYNAAWRAAYSHFRKGQMTKTLLPIPVISTEAGQPPIGKPLIVQARGQLRLTWRLYAESPQSGEISLSHGMQQAGCLSSWGAHKKGAVKK